MKATFVHSRVDQEIAKEGVLPYSPVFAGTFPSGSLTGGLFLHFIPSIIMIPAIPFRDAYNFVVDVEGYPRAIVFQLVVVGLFFLRRKNPYTERFNLKPRLPVAGFSLVEQAFLLVAPFLRPKGGKGDTSQLYWAYPLLGISVMVFIVIYYIVLLHLLPKIGRYELRREKVVIANGTTLVKFVQQQK